MANRNLHKAKTTKNDEFYTRLEDIEAEAYHYWRHFKNKVVYLNCDDPLESKFWDYFAKQFEHLKLKKLIATSYIGGLTGRAMKFVYEGDQNGNGVPDIDEIEITPLAGDGDFRSPECVELLKEADIVCTNPPFSLFREYVAQLVQYKKKFLIIGNMNALTYKEMFPLIRENKVWMGVVGGSRSYRVPDNTPIGKRGCYEDGGQKFVKLGNTCWFTNMNHKKRNQPIDLIALYDPDKHLAYDNYDAINVDSVKDIPEDYPGVMGVPITFLDKYCPRQFEILNCNDLKKSRAIPSKPHGLIKDKEGSVNGKTKYVRVLIRNLHPITTEE